MHHLLEIDSVIKNFGTRQLLSDVYLRINTGDVIGLFGRNGTGKSVLMQIIFGTMKADRKFIRLDGCKILPAPYRHSGTIAFLPQQGYLPKHQKMKQLVRYYLDTDVVSDFIKMMKWHNRVWTDVSHSFPEVNGDIWKPSYCCLATLNSYCWMSRLIIYLFIWRIN